MKDKTSALNSRLQMTGNYSRRRFISSCSACAACLAVAPAAVLSASCRTNSAKRLKIRVIYSLHSEVQIQPDWPNVGFNFKPAMEMINSSLISRFRDIDFIPALANGPEEAEKIAGKDKVVPVDGYIVYQMNCWNQVIQTFAQTGKPVLYADFKYGGSGGFLVYTSSFLRSGQSNVGFIASSRINDMLEAIECMKSAIKNGTPSEYGSLVSRVRTKLTAPAGTYSVLGNNIEFLSGTEGLKRMKKSKIIAVKDQKSALAEPLFDIPLEYAPFSEVNAAWSSADKDESRSIAEKWQKNASSVTGVSFETLVNSAAMYLGMKSVLKTRNANAITINCLGGFYGGHIHAYPCLGFHELCNEGLVGGCECDVNSTATMLAFSILSNGRPGFISDPVIDTAKRQIIYTHCVASNRVFGPGRISNKFEIMTHSEDRNGASVRSLLPVNYLTTTLELNNERKEILIHQAVAVDNDPDDRACRTKLCAEPKGDIEKLFLMWDKWGWHRVTFYGDFREPVNELAKATGWTVIEEA